MEFDEILKLIKPLLKVGAATLEDLVAAGNLYHEDKVLMVIRWLMDNEKIDKDRDGKYGWC